MKFITPLTFLALLLATTSVQAGQSRYSGGAGTGDGPNGGPRDVQVNGSRGGGLNNGQNGARGGAGSSNNPNKANQKQPRNSGSGGKGKQTDVGDENDATILCATSDDSAEDEKEPCEPRDTVPSNIREGEGGVGTKRGPKSQVEGSGNSNPNSRQRSGRKLLRGNN